MGGLTGPRGSGRRWLCEVLGLASSLRLLPCDVWGRDSLGDDGPRSIFPKPLSKLACFFLSVFFGPNVGKGLSQAMVLGERGSAGRIRSLAIVEVSLCCVGVARAYRRGDKIRKWGCVHLRLDLDLMSRFAGLGLSSDLLTRSFL